MLLLLKLKTIQGEVSESICCDTCKNWVHFRCTGLSQEELNHVISTDNQFTCDRCRSTCSNCKKLCRINQKVHTCKTCKQKIHEKCKTDDFGGFLIDPFNDSSIFYCDSCLPTSDADETLAPILPNLDNSSLIASDIEFSDAHSSDFDWESVTESDDELRGLNFASLPVQSVSSFNARVEKSHLPRIGLRTINYKYPCNVL